jgi:hypothetical protein
MRRYANQVLARSSCKARGAAAGRPGRLAFRVVLRITGAVPPVKRRVFGGPGRVTEERARRAPALLRAAAGRAIAGIDRVAAQAGPFGEAWRAAIRARLRPHRRGVRASHRRRRVLRPAGPSPGPGRSG